ncbi:MAG TPA: DUF5654 family protein [Candidatus Moranbacteria bacterium]|nr:DUF5654 family protein [Candidatus Moranbacteria bacterium]
MEPIQNKFKKEVSDIRREVRNKIAGYITAAFGLVAGLAWNDAIKSLIEYFFPLGANNLWVKFIYAIAITLAVVIISIYLMKIFRDKEEK